jgi:ribosomal protein S6--L-glutamate ligase
MGYGKCRITSDDVWKDSVDMAIASRDIVAIEPFVGYRRDIRILLVGQRVFAAERVAGRGQWKANVCPDRVYVTDPPEMLVKLTRKAAAVLNMEIVGADWIEDGDGNWILLEVNPAPGLQMGNLNCRPFVMELINDLAV